MSRVNSLGLLDTQEFVTCFKVKHGDLAWSILIDEGYALHKTVGQGCMSILSWTLPVILLPDSAHLVSVLGNYLVIVGTSASHNLFSDNHSRYSIEIVY